MKQKQMKMEYYGVLANAIGIVRAVVDKHGEENIADVKAVFEQLRDIEIKASDRVKVAREKLEQAKQLFEQLQLVASKY